MTARQILVTGSRDWDDISTIEQALELAATKLGSNDIVLISGACPTGADRIAENIWLRKGRTIDLHKANWELHGKSAGYVRNVEMVDLEPDICLAFIKDGSRGATMTKELAIKAGIETWIFERGKNSGHT